jgi:hypothetical protein
MDICHAHIEPPRSSLGITNLKKTSHNLYLNVFYGQDLATSNFHPFVASAGADGSCMVVNVIRKLKRQKHPTQWNPKVYRIDFNRRTGELRMVDNIIPEVK